MAIVTYYCGEDALVKVSTDEGLTWITRNYSPGSPGILYDIMAWPLQPDKVTTVGNVGLIQMSTDQGVSWNNASPVLGSNVTFEEVWNIDSTYSVVCGTNNVTPLFYTPVFYKSIDAGVSYTSLPIRDAANPGTDLFKTGKAMTIHFMTPLVGVMGIIGNLNTLPGYPVVGSNEVLYVLLTLDGGVTWEVTNNKFPIDLTDLNNPWGIKISYDAPSTEYIINLVAEKTLHRSIDSGVTYSSPEFYPTGTAGRHLTWIGDTPLWYTRSGTGSSMQQSLTVGAGWNTIQASLGSISRAAHFYQGPVIITGFYSIDSRLLKTIDEGASSSPSDITPAQQLIWAVWTEQDIPFKCYLLQDCQDPTRQFIFTDQISGTACGFDFASNIGNTVVIQYILDPASNPCPVVADGVTCWLIVQEATCGTEFCNQIITS